MKLNQIIVYIIFAILILGAFLPVVSYLLIGLLIALIIASKQEKIVWNHLMQNKILLMMIASAVFSSLFSDLWYISILFSILYIMKILFCSIVSCYLEERHINLVIIVVMILGIIVSIIGIIQYFYFDNNMPESWVDSEVYRIDFRAYSTFFNPNILAVFLDLTILTAVVHHESNKKSLCRAFALLCSTLSTMCLLLTYSRNGWISLCISFITLFLINRKYMKYAVIFPILFISFDFFSDTGRLLPQNIAADSSIDYRIKIWKTSLYIIKNNLILGIGQGTVWEQIPIYSNELKAYVSHVHNIYLQRLVDTGIVGLSLFISFIKYLWNKIKLDVFDNKDISLISMGFYIVLLVNGLLDAVSFQEQISIFVWTFIGINLTVTKVYNLSEENYNRATEHTFTKSD
ncbi:hypothetical protein DW1_1495 [Proteiniborus sp. DW1]|uniref:O-antigen ligase family protein n=1 Tax=Proteiniborus sp. DW1 TaxID=1889883 RepID=UPI00092E0536|nr:O-antigen ligase family protein [Proteiniborus sp. DW1]SCG83066.1 hypothetical protein DW1_1495 [Proteiniborus sp. DW1]